MPRKKPTPTPTIIADPNLDAPKPIPTFNETLAALIEPHKLAILNHPAHRKVLTGAKDSGKTFIAAIDGIRSIYQSPYAYVLAGRKYKTLAAERLSATFTNAAMELQSMGVPLARFQRSVNHMYYIKNSQKDLTKNQSISFFSFEDVNSIAGIEAPNLGYFSTVIIDEPVLAGDAPTTPETTKLYRRDLKILEDSVNRSTLKHATIKGLERPKTTYWVLLNMWDPESLEVNEINKIIPEEAFMEFILGEKDLLSKPYEYISRKWPEIWNNILHNHTKAVYNEGNDTLYVKMSKFSNKYPRSEAHKYEEEIKTAILTNTKDELARLLGFTNDDALGNRALWDMRKWQKAKHEALTKNEWALNGISVGIDIDENEEIVVTPALLYNQGLKSSNAPDAPLITREKVFLAPQIIIPAYGRGAIGSKNIDTYIAGMVKAIKEIFTTYNPNRFDLFHGEKVIVDDNHGLWIHSILPEIRTEFPNAGFIIAPKHNTSTGAGSWGRNYRTKTIQHAGDSQYIIFAEENTRLWLDMARAVKSLDGKTRDESKAYARLYNTINSAEYAIYPYKSRAYLMNDVRLGISEGEGHSGQ